jgi:hypothetical protein
MLIGKLNSQTLRKVSYVPKSREANMVDTF